MGRVERAEFRPAVPRAAPAVAAESLLPAFQAVLWEARGDPWELVALTYGPGARPFLQLEGLGQDRRIRWLEHVYPLDRLKLEEFLAMPAGGGSRGAIEYRLILASGEFLWVRHWILHRGQGADGRPRLTGVIGDITEEKRLEWECLRIGERERSRMGQELHDDVCQVLAGLSCMMRALARRVTATAPDLAGEFAELDKEVVSAMQRTRLLAHGLCPTGPRHRTIRPALVELVRLFDRRFQLAVALDLPRHLPPHTAEQILHIYRLVQEAVSNARCHGKATRVSIGLQFADGRGSLRIADNGTGFPDGAAQSEGVGLGMMSYRAGILGGTLTHGNALESGAVVQLHYPLATSRRQRVLREEGA